MEERARMREEIEAEMMAERAQMHRRAGCRQFDANASSASTWDGRSGRAPALDAVCLLERQRCDFVSEAIRDGQPSRQSRSPDARVREARMPGYRIHLPRTRRGSLLAGRLYQPPL